MMYFFHGTFLKIKNFRKSRLHTLLESPKKRQNPKNPIELIPIQIPIQIQEPIPEMPDTSEEIPEIIRETTLELPEEIRSQTITIQPRVKQSNFTII